MMTESPLPELAASRKPTFRWGRLMVLAIVVGLLVILGFGVLRAQQGQVGKGQPAPNFTVTGLAGTPLAGQTFTLSEARGKVVVVNFWASWCIPCRDEAPVLETAWQRYKDRGVVVVGLAWTDTESKSLDFIREFSQTYLNGPDLRTLAGQTYRIKGVPETYVVDPNGVLAWVKIGPLTSLEELQSVIEPLLPQ
jgi:cytochrome c biogenesis protein CcmG/thiol:disulfide interchange protein DsbE